MKISFLTALRVFVPFAAGYFLSYLYRVVNAVIAPDLVGDLGIGPSALGLLTSTYFIAFASSQLPLGVLLDRFGPRRVEAFLLLFAGLGAFLFSSSGTLTGLVSDGRPLDSLGRLASALESIALDDLNGLARSGLYAWDTLTVVIVGDAAEVVPQLVESGFGEPTRYGPDGEPAD